MSTSEYITADGAKFLAPPDADFAAMKAYGQSIKDLGTIARLWAVGAAVGQGGRFDVQRKGTIFYSQYTDAANFAVGVVMQSAGYPPLRAGLDEPADRLVASRL